MLADLVRTDRHNHRRAVANSDMLEAIKVLARSHHHRIWTRQRPGGTPGGGCAPGYHPCVPPYPPDIDCGDVNGPIRVMGDDPHGLDGDGDSSSGDAC